jgi:hypothetical protein
MTTCGGRGREQEGEGSLAVAGEDRRTMGEGREGRIKREDRAKRRSYTLEFSASNPWVSLAAGQPLEAVTSSLPT